MNKTEYLEQKILMYKLEVELCGLKEGNVSDVRFFYKSNLKTPLNEAVFFEICENGFRKIDNNAEYHNYQKVDFVGGDLCYGGYRFFPHTIYKAVLKSGERSLAYSKFKNSLCNRFLGKGEKSLVEIKSVLKLKRFLNKMIEKKKLVSQKEEQKQTKKSDLQKKKNLRIKSNEKSAQDKNQKTVDELENNLKQF